MVQVAAGEVKGRLDRLEVCFDDEHAVANAGLVLSATLAGRLGIVEAADEMIGLGEVPGAALPGRKVMSLIHSMALGGDSIDDADVLRSGETARVLGHAVMAPSTLGTFLRAFTFGHVRQLDRLSETVLTRAWQAGAGPDADSLVIDIDSSVCEVYGYKKQGASFGYTKRRGYHPLLATRAGSGEVLHARQRKGAANTARGAAHFIAEVCGRVRRAGASGLICLRADSGFHAKNVIDACQKADVRFSITARLTAPVRTVIAAVDEEAWQAIDYTEQGEAQVAETTYKNTRLVVAPASSRNRDKENSSPAGATTPSSPTSTDPRSNATNSTATTPCANSPSATSKKKASPTPPQGCSPRTPPGLSSHPWPTTSHAG